MKISRLVVALIAAIAFVAVGCVPAAEPVPSPLPSIVPTQSTMEEPETSPISSLTPTELKYRLRAEFDDKIFLCGPPVVAASSDSSSLDEQFTMIRQDEEVFRTILQHNDLSLSGPWSDQEKIIVIREHNILSAVTLQPSGDEYRFSLWVPNDGTIELTQEPVEDTEPQMPKNVISIEGFIDQTGVISIIAKEPFFYECPK